MATQRASLPEMAAIERLLTECSDMVTQRASIGERVDSGISGVVAPFPSASDAMDQLGGLVGYTESVLGREMAQTKALIEELSADWRRVRPAAGEGHAEHYAPELLKQLARRYEHMGIELLRIARSLDLQEASCSADL